MPAEPPTSPTQLLFTDLDGAPRGKLLSAAKLRGALAAGGLGFCDVAFGWDLGDAPYDGDDGATGWHRGYPDARLCVRETDVRGDGALVVGDFAGGHLEGLCPRSLLRRVLAEAERMGLRVHGALEYEWVNLTRASVDAGGLPEPATAGMHGYSVLRPAAAPGYADELWAELAGLDVPLEGLHTETGPGYYEAAYHYAEGLELADRAALLKLGVKRVGLRRGYASTFMAKWRADLPGCGGHFHQSLASLDGGRPLLAEPGGADGGLSAAGRHYLAGQLLWLPRLLALYAPTVNSYKRLVPGSWAPTHVGWGVDNRTVAVRVIPGGSNTRIELRVPGADANPYLVAAAAVASGLYGIAEALPLELPPVGGDAYTAGGELVPLATNLAAATTALREHRDAAADLLGAEFVDHFLRTRDWEWRRAEAAVTDWERDRYLELV